MKVLNRIKEELKTVKAKLFFTLSCTILMIIFFLIFLNSFALENFYIYSKQNTLVEVYNQLNDYYNGKDHELDLEAEMERIAIKNNFDILIKDTDNITIYSSSKNFYAILDSANSMNPSITGKINNGKTLEENEKFIIKQQRDFKNGLTYVMLSGAIDNGYELYIRIPITSIQDSVKISNNFLILIAGFTILISAVLVTIISRKFTEPIIELNKIAKKMSNLDFSHKYRITDADD